jgi:glycyl-tRNA synthetase beta chain
VTVAVALADKLDNIVSFNFVKETATGSKDPYALRRSALGIIRITLENRLRLPLDPIALLAWQQATLSWNTVIRDPIRTAAVNEFIEQISRQGLSDALNEPEALAAQFMASVRPDFLGDVAGMSFKDSEAFIIDRLKVQQREAGIRHDLIDAVFAVGGEDDLVRLLARVHALQAFVETEDGADLLTAYKRAANILKKENWVGTGASGGPDLEPQEEALIAALNVAEPDAAAAIEAEDFTGAMAALATLRGPIDDFFDHVTVNDPDPAKRERRLNLLMRFRDAVNRVADFSKIEG